MRILHGYGRIITKGHTSRRSSLLCRLNIKSCLILCVVKCTNSEKCTNSKNCMKLYLRIVNFDEYIKLCIHDFLYTQFFHLRKFKLTIPTKSWISHKLYETICVNCGFSTTPSQNFVKCKNGLYMKCRFRWVEQYWYSWLFHSRPSRVTKPLRGYELSENSKFNGSNFSKWKVDH